MAVLRAAPIARFGEAIAADPPALGAARAGAPLVAAMAAVALGALARHRPAGLGLLALAAWGAWFFRDPPRRCPGAPGTLYAAADGVITAVDEVDGDWFIRGRALRLVTFLSAFDVHVNRSPAAGRLMAYRRDPGSFAPAFFVGGSAGNARQLLGIEVAGGRTPPPFATPSPHHLDSSGACGPGASPLSAERRGGAASEQRPPANRIVVAQVVGFLARRIVTWRLPGDTLAAGQKLGMIRFGSRTDVLVPAGLAEPLVSPGATVRAGLTPIARYRTRS